MGVVVFAAIVKLRRRRPWQQITSHHSFDGIFGATGGSSEQRRTCHRETYIYNFPYFLVPWIYGLGAPMIVFDTAKIFRSNYLIYSAICDLRAAATRAFSDHDAPTLVRAILLALRWGRCRCWPSPAFLSSTSRSLRCCSVPLRYAREIVPFWFLLTVSLAKMVASVRSIAVFRSSGAARPIFVVAMTAGAGLHRTQARYRRLRRLTPPATIGTMLAFIAMIRGPARRRRDHADGACPVGNYAEDIAQRAPHHGRRRCGSNPNCGDRQQHRSRRVNSRIGAEEADDIERRLSIQP